jgi:hypothetical protein
MAPKRELTVDEILELLTELGQRLSAKGVRASLYIVGGAAIAIELDTRRVTADVDAVFHPEATVAAEAAAMADERGLPRQWLNQSAAAWVPGASSDTGAVLLDVPGLSVAVASPLHLLAMKMAAFRPTDRADLELLFRELDITTPERAADAVAAVYGDHHGLPDRAELLLSARAVLEGRGRRHR